MIRNTEFFEMIEDYCLDLLSKELKNEFETELKQNPELRKEVELQLEIRDAIIEQDVLTFRGKLEKVAKQNTPKSVGTDSFELFNEFSDIQEISEVLSSEELINFYDSLPKVHAYHHEATSNENIHQFYKDQRGEKGLNGFEDDLEDFDFDLEFEGLEEAILEKDVLNLRLTLKQVAKSVEPQFTVEEIDEYIHGELTGDDLLEFEKDFVQNRSLREEVLLHNELEMAVQEYDIMDIRNQISNIIQTETSWNVSEKSIEDFIDGILEGEQLEEFRNELRDNVDLKAEVKLRQQINDFLGESDIKNLRNELNIAKDKAEVKKVKMLIPETKTSHITFLRRSVAVIIVLIGITGILGNKPVSVEKIYDNNYETQIWSPGRAAVEHLTYLQRSNKEYNNGNYLMSFKILDSAPNDIKNNPVFYYYEAAILQKLNRYSEAISLYTKVIQEGDNIFVEEAEWYRSLCYLKSGNQNMAKQELLAVLKRKGSYEIQADAIIKKLRYSFK